MKRDLFACPTGSLGIRRGLSVSVFPFALLFAEDPEAEFCGRTVFPDVCAGGAARPEVCGGDTGLTRV